VNKCYRIQKQIPEPLYLIFNRNVRRRIFVLFLFMLNNESIDNYPPICVKIEAVSSNGSKICTKILYIFDKTGTKTFRGIIFSEKYYKNPPMIINAYSKVPFFACKYKFLKLKMGSASEEVDKQTSCICFNMVSVQI